MIRSISRDGKKSIYPFLLKWAMAFIFIYIIVPILLPLVVLCLYVYLCIIILPLFIIFFFANLNGEFSDNYFPMA